MKLKILSLVIIISLVFFACQSDKSKDTQKEVAKEKVEKGYIVSLDVVVKKDDTFSLYYTEDGSIDFTKIEPIWVDVKGQNFSQEVVFKIPEKVTPTQLRIDLGINKNQEEMILKSFKMKHLDKSFEAQGPAFFEYFRPDESKTKADPQTGIVTAVVNKGERQHPSFYPNEAALGGKIATLK